MAEYRGILICGELADGRITIITKELVNIGRKLSGELHQPLSILFIGWDVSDAAAEAITLGCSKVYVVGGSSFADSSPDLYLGTATAACRQIAPQVILMDHTGMGRDIAPRLAVRLEASVVMDCVELAVAPDTKLLLQTRPVYGGRAMALWVSESNRPQVITVRPRSVMPAEPDISNNGKVVNLTVTVEESTIITGKLVETVKQQAGDTKLEEAKVIVTGGGGIGGREGFRMIDSLARLLRGAIGITRVVSDEGWMPSNMQIGQTGHIVRPNLYIAVGVSGASQHITGCLGSKYIVAINKDPDAYIFKVSDFGVVGDYKEALPPLIEKLKALLAI